MTASAELDAMIRGVRRDLGVVAGAAANGFDDVLARLERLEAFCFGTPVNGFGGAGGEPKPLTLVPDED